MTGWSPFAGFALKNEFKIPLLATIHATEHGRNHGYVGSDISQAIHAAEWWLTYEAWRVICCSGFMAREVADVFRTPPDKIDVIPNGIDTSRFDALQGANLSALPLDLRRARRAHRLPCRPHCAREGVGRAGRGHAARPGRLPQDQVRHRRHRRLSGIGASAGLHSLASPRASTSPASSPTPTATGCSRWPTSPSSPACMSRSASSPWRRWQPARRSWSAMSAGWARSSRTTRPACVVYPNNPDSLAWGISETLRHPDWAAARADNAYRQGGRRLQLGAHRPANSRCLCAHRRRAVRGAVVAAMASLQREHRDVIVPTWLDRRTAP